MSRLGEDASSFFTYKYVLPTILAAGSVAGTAGFIFVANVYKAPAVQEVNGERQEIVTDIVGHSVPTNSQDPDLYATETAKAESLRVKLRESENAGAGETSSTALEALKQEILAAQAEHRAIIAQVTKFDGTYRNCDVTPLAQQLYFQRNTFSYNINFDGKTYQDLQSMASFERNRKFEMVNQLKGLPGCIKPLYDAGKTLPQADRYVTDADLENYYNLFPAERPNQNTAGLVANSSGSDALNRTSLGSGSNGSSSKLSSEDFSDSAGGGKQ